ncbi:hypothetical protein [Paenibacillus sp. J22TS3]|uniref:hypothetical protein n=1 Tax=Paenibacillus sp. J22TS3 TaxID=2807192 RepID=UPI001BCD5693|nr:hypothetical protein [Paenibacillus sp. J22TS3]
MGIRTQAKPIPQDERLLKRSRSKTLGSSPTRIRTQAKQIPEGERLPKRSRSKALGSSSHGGIALKPSESRRESASSNAVEIKRSEAALTRIRTQAKRIPEGERLTERSRSKTLEAALMGIRTQAMPIPQGERLPERSRSKTLESSTHAPGRSAPVERAPQGRQAANRTPATRVLQTLRRPPTESGN